MTRPFRHYNAILSVLFCFLGLLLPYIAGIFYLERMLMTMYIFILLGGFVLTMNYAVLCAVIIPVLNCFLLGLPELYPEFPIVVCQSIAYAAGANMLYSIMRRKLYPSLLFAISLGLVIQFCAISILSWVADGISAFSYMRDSLLTGLPGILLHIAVVPPLVLLTEKTTGARNAGGATL